MAPWPLISKKFKTELPDSKKTNWRIQKKTEKYLKSFSQRKKKKLLKYKKKKKLAEYNFFIKRECIYLYNNKVQNYQ